MDMYSGYYQSFLGTIRIASDDVGLVGLSFIGKEKIIQETPNFMIEEAKAWLDVYFTGKEPDFMPKLHLIGTDFQKCVWNIVKEIPYGKTVSYGYVASFIAQERGIKRMSAQAVGSAIGQNPISIIIPCHRVIRSDGSLGWYSGGADKKRMLLKSENAI